MRTRRQVLAVLATVGLTAAVAGGVVAATQPSDEAALAPNRGAPSRNNPHVILTTGCKKWDTGVDVVVEGDAVRVTDERVLERLAEASTKKWDGRWAYEVRDGAFHHEGGGTAIVFSVTPTKVFAFAKGTFGQTRHRFE